MEIKELEKYNAWLSFLKPGDAVIFHTWNWVENSYTLRFVHHVTPTGRIVLDGLDAQFKNGRAIGAYSGELLNPDDQKAIIAMKIYNEALYIRKAAKRIEKLAYKLNYEQSVKVSELIDSFNLLDEKTE